MMNIKYRFISTNVFLALILQIKIGKDHAPTNLYDAINLVL